MRSPSSAWAKYSVPKCNLGTRKKEGVSTPNMEGAQTELGNEDAKRNLGTRGEKAEQ
jgi:hypothetical protein